MKEQSALKTYFFGVALGFGFAVGERLYTAASWLFMLCLTRIMR